jgi:hypothetical protein
MKLGIHSKMHIKIHSKNTRQYTQQQQLGIQYVGTN